VVTDRWFIYEGQNFRVAAGWLHSLSAMLERVKNHGAAACTVNDHAGWSQWIFTPEWVNWAHATLVPHQSPVPKAVA